MADDQDNECAICYEPTATRVELPCRCAVSYCSRCWDKALAQSFTNTGQSRCPTCRTPVRVDYDAETGRLLFSPQAEAQGNNPSQQQDDVERLAQQAMPRQCRLLREYGQRHALLQELHRDPMTTMSRLSVSALKQHLEELGTNAAGCAEKSDLVEKILTTVGNSESLVAYWAGAQAASSGEAPSLPVCVCGSELQRVSWKDRTIMTARHFYGQVDVESDAFQRFMAQQSEFSGLICDLCDGKIDRCRGVWTCVDGNSTVLHAYSYDVCDACFARNVASEEEADGASTPVS